MSEATSENTDMLDGYHPIISGPAALKHAVDAIAVAGVGASILDWPHLPGLYEFLGVVWVSIRIYETALVQRLVRRIKKFFR